MFTKPPFVERLGNPRGTLTSIAITAASILAITGSPITTAGTIDIGLATQAANLTFAGPSSGSPAIPTFRTLVKDDIPWAIPGTIGSTTPNTGAFTTLACEHIDITKTQDATTGITITNANVSTGAISNLYLLSDVAQLQIRTHSSARTAQHMGITLGGYNQVSTSVGNGLLINTVNATPIVLGTNNTEAFRISSAQVITCSSTLQATRLISTVATGTAPLTVASTTQVTNLNASQLVGKTWAIPNPIGSTTRNTIECTTFSSNAGIYPGSANTNTAQTAVRLWAGTGTPNGSYGSDGDFYFRSTVDGSGRIYVKYGGIWGILF